MIWLLCNYYIYICMVKSIGENGEKIYKYFYFNIVLKSMHVYAMLDRK